MEDASVNPPLLAPTCFRGWGYRRDLSSSQPEGTAQGCIPAPLPLPSHTSLEEEKPGMMFDVRMDTKPKQRPLSFRA